MSPKFRFIPYSKNFKLSRSKSLNTIIEEQQSNMSLVQENQTAGTSQSTQNQQTRQPQNNSTDIFNCLRIPDAIKDLPKFDGNPRLLHEFISNVEEILLYIRGCDNTPQGLILLRAIRNKIDGQANEVLNMYGTSLNWDDIKTNLISHYSDKRTETSLIKDLHSLRQYGKPVEKFYSEILEIQASLANNVSIHETDKNVISAKRDLFSEMCLNSFLSGLREPMGSIVRAMRPESLPMALDYCIREQNIHYLRNDTLRQKFSTPKPNFRNGPYPRQIANYNTVRPYNNNYAYRDFNNTQPRNNSQNLRNYNQKQNIANNQTNWRQPQNYQNKNF